MEAVPYGQVRPAADEKPMRDLQFALTGGTTALIAFELGLFNELAERDMTAAQVAESLGLSHRATQALLSVSCGCGFLEGIADGYRLTGFGRDYLVPSGASFFGAQLNQLIDVAKQGDWSYEKLKEAVLSDNPQSATWGQDIFNYETPKAIEENAAQRVVSVFHTLSFGPSTAWPDHVDLSSHQTILDIGGASGAHAMGAVARWPNLTGILLDFEPVCQAAEEVITRHGMGEKVMAHPADMFNHPFPEADVHFYSNILHDWPIERGESLVKKSFASLPPGGLIILHEMLFNDDKSGPPAVAAVNLNMLNAMLGQQFSGPELIGLLEGAGFVEVTSNPTFAYYFVIVGKKPAD